MAYAFRDCLPWLPIGQRRRAGFVENDCNALLRPRHRDVEAGSGVRLKIGARRDELGDRHGRDYQHAFIRRSLRHFEIQAVKVEGLA